MDDFMSKVEERLQEIKGVKHRMYFLEGANFAMKEAYHKSMNTSGYIRFIVSELTDSINSGTEE